MPQGVEGQRGAGHAGSLGRGTRDQVERSGVIVEVGGLVGR